MTEVDDQIRDHIEEALELTDDEEVSFHLRQTLQLLDAEAV